MASESTALSPISDPKSAYNALRSHKQKKFVRYYIGAANGNATKAAEMAGYSGSENSLRSIGSQNLTKLNIKEAIRELQEAAVASDREVLRILSEQATASMGDFFDIVEVEQYVSYGRDETVIAQAVAPGANGAEIEQADEEEIQERGYDLDGNIRVAKVTSKVPVLNLEKAKRRGKLHLIKKISYDKYGRPQLELHDSQKALIHLSKRYDKADSQEAEETKARRDLRSALQKAGINLNQVNISIRAAP